MKSPIQVSYQNRLGVTSHSPRPFTDFVDRTQSSHLRPQSRGPEGRVEVTDDQHLINKVWMSPSNQLQRHGVKEVDILTVSLEWINSYLLNRIFREFCHGLCIIIIGK